MHDTTNPCGQGIACDTDCLTGCFKAKLGSIRFNTSGAQGYHGTDMTNKQWLEKSTAMARARGIEPEHVSIEEV